MCKLRVRLPVFVLVHQERTYEHWWLIRAFVHQSQVTIGGYSEANVLVKYVERWIDAKDTEFVGISAKLANLLQLSVVSQNKKQIRVNRTFANKYQ